MRDGNSGGTDVLDADAGVLMHGATWRVPRQTRDGDMRGIDSGTRKLAWTAAGLGGALVVVIGLYSALGHHSTVVPVIQADSRPIRMKPENRGGMQINGADEDAMGGNASGLASKMAPVSEVPAPKMLRAQQDNPPAPVASPTVSEAAVPPAAIAPVTEKPNLGTVVPVAKLPSPKPPVAKVAPSRPSVQIAALGSEAAALAEWRHLTATLPDLFGNRQPMVSRTEHDGHVLWRLRTSGFTDVAQATAFCERVRSKRAGCSIASF